MRKNKEKKIREIRKLKNFDSIYEERKRDRKVECGRK